MISILKAFKKNVYFFGGVKQEFGPPFVLAER